jgi:hypothetical protein
MGLEYGSRFRPLTDMTAHPLEHKVVASIKNDVREAESPYAVHPGILDGMPQSLGPALTRGLTRLFKKLALPTYIDEFYVRPPPKKDMRLLSQITEERTSSYIGDIIAVSDGQVVVEMKGFQASVISDGYDDEAGEDHDPHAAVELEWKEDVNLMDPAVLITRAKDRDAIHVELDRFSSLCFAETVDMLQGVEPTREHLKLFFDWLVGLVNQIKKGSYPGLQNKEDMALCENPVERRVVLEEMYTQLQQTEVHPAATAIYRIMKNSTGIFDGTTEELGILLEDNVLHLLYDLMQNSEYSGFIDVLGHRKPNLRVLEIGAGTGGTTATVLPILRSAYGERMYGSYTYTDISAGFFPAAKERFKEYAAVEFAILDVTKDPVEQGFEPESFDLVFASNVRLLTK